MKNKIVTLGEIMLRFSTKENKTFFQAEEFNINYGGAEANVAILLSSLGEDVSFITKLPENHLGMKAKKLLELHGVKTNNVILSGDKIGSYYVEKGFGVRESKIIYDRKFSEMSLAKEVEFNIENALKDATVFHVSGVTAALGDEHVKLIKKCLQYCKENKVKISIDLNYRSKLWSFKKFSEVMGELIQDADLVFGWIDEGAEEFKKVSFENEIEERRFFEEKFNMLSRKFNVKAMATTIREVVNANKNKIKGIYIDEEDMVFSKKYEFDILDRIGAGDAFAGGLIYKMINKGTKEECIEFATCTNVYKHSINGDFLSVEESEISRMFSNSKLDVDR